MINGYCFETSYGYYLNGHSITKCDSTNPLCKYQSNFKEIEPIECDSNHTIFFENNKLICKETKNECKKHAPSLNFVEIDNF